MRILHLNSDTPDTKSSLQNCEFEYLLAQATICWMSNQGLVFYDDQLSPIYVNFIVLESFFIQLCRGAPRLIEFALLFLYD